MDYQKEQQTPTRYTKRTIFNLPPSEMTPYLIAKKDRQVIMKNKQCNTFDRILGSNNMNSNKKGIFYKKVGEENQNFTRNKKAFRVQQSTPNQKYTKGDLQNRDDNSRIRQSHGNLIVSDVYSNSKITASTNRKNNYYNAVWKSETDDAYGGNPIVYNPLLRSMTNNKHLERNWHLFFGTIEPCIELLEKKCVNVADSRNCEEIVSDIRNSMKPCNDINYKGFDIKEDNCGNQVNGNRSNSQNPLGFDSQVIESNCEGDALDKELNKEGTQCPKTPITKARQRDLIRDGEGEIENIPIKKMLAAGSVMKRPDQLLGFVPAMGGVYMPSNGTYGSGRIAHY